MFEYLVIYMYIAPGQGQTTPLGPKYFHKHKSSVHLHIPSKIFAIFLIFPIQMHGWPKFTLLKKGQVHPKVMIYTNFLELHCLMLHAKFQNHMPSGSEEKGF